MMILPPLEIAKQIRFAEGTVYYVGVFDKQQLKLFNDYKKKAKKRMKTDISKTARKKAVFLCVR